MYWEIITSAERFKAIVSNWTGLIACDVETYGDRWADNKRLLGVSLSPEYTSDSTILGIYIPFNVYTQNKVWVVDCEEHFQLLNGILQEVEETGHWEIQGGTWSSPVEESLQSSLAAWLITRQLVGHNFTYDKWWVDNELGIDTTWKVDTRIMWHLASAPAGPRPYGLKDAMVEVLGWRNTNDAVLASEVKARGGSLRNGDHYIASLETLAHYATLDTHATIEVYKSLKSFFDTHSYWDFLSQMMEYNILLDKNTTQGILVAVPGLQKAHNRLLKAKEAASKRFHKELKDEIDSLEKDWADRRIAEYKREYNKIRYANHPEEWKRFNLNSDKDKRELFFDKIGLTSTNSTPSGMPSVNEDSIKRHNANFVESYLKYEKANTLSTNFSGPYLNSVCNNRLHPGFNICGTVSYRLSGFKPYLLNAPFDEKAILRNLRVEDGYVGIHADLSAIEPTVTAHYSEDSSLLKVFREGRGDIYLDLALELFPNDKDLHEGYNPDAPITEEIKKIFNKQRKIAKIIQLAVAYTGTGHTVSNNLTKAGIPTSVDEGERLVQAYWRKFFRVALFNYRLRELNRQQGYLRNIVGRIIRVHDPNHKDLPNRFIQSSAHDILILWVLEIYRLAKEAGIEIKPILLDCHDSTSNQVREKDAERVKRIYQQALDNINKRLGLCVTIKAEIKTFKTLAGLKAQE